MTEIRIVIEGEDAIAARNALLEIPGISGYDEVTKAPEKEGTLATVAAIVTIVGVSFDIVEHLKKWYQEYRKENPSPKIEKVVIIAPNGLRLLLTTETIDNETTIKIVKIFDDSRQK